MKAVAALHNSEYGSFNKEGKLRPVGDLSDDNTLDELGSMGQTYHRQHFNVDATNNDVSDIATHNPG